MRNIFRFLSKAKGAILGIILLLIIQAYCELALPSYTSDLLNVGLQQGGIESALPTQIQDSSLETLELFMSDEDAAVVDDAFEAADAQGIRKVRSDIDKEAIADLLTIPECVVYQLGQMDSASISVEQIQAAVASGMMTKDQLLTQMDAQISQMENMTGTYLNQIAVLYVSDEYAAQGVDLNALRSKYLWTVGAKMLAMAAVMMIVSIVAGLIASVVSSKVGMDLREQLYQKVMSFTGMEMEKYSTASMITRATNDVQQIQMVSVMLLRLVIYAPILAIGGIIKVVQTSVGMSWVIVLAVAVLMSVIVVLMSVSLPKFKKMQILVDDLNLVSREILTGIMPIRAFSRERHEEVRFDAANRSLFETQLFTNRVMSFMFPVMMFVMNGISVLIIWVGGHKVDAGTIQVGDLTAFITYSMVIVMGFLMLSMISILLPRAGVAADRIREVLDTEVSIKDPSAAKDAQLSVPKGEIEFHDVTFAYPNAEEPAISHISFVAEAGKTTALIGSTGCGKSSVLNLIPRFFDPTEGSVTFDGVDIRDLSQKKLREMLGFVPQKGTLFSGTIESNLKYGGDHISDEDMNQAAQIAQAMEFISSKEGTFASSIAQGGSNVSGGQKQRLSIARAIAKHPKVYLFDDSFSALDFKTDLALRKALSEQTEDSTVIIVAQRISTILHADRIVVMDEGKIVGIGTHEELLENCRTYQEIARSQLSEAELAGIHTADQIAAENAEVLTAADSDSNGKEVEA